LLESQLGQQQQKQQVESHESSAKAPDDTATNNANPAPAMSGEIMAELEHSLRTDLDEDSENYFAQIAGWIDSEPTCVTTSACVTSASSDTGGFSSLGDCQDVESALTAPDAMSMTLARHLELGDATPPLILSDFECSDLMWADLWVNTVPIYMLPDIRRFSC
jgi:hypothetical protein